MRISDWSSDVCSSDLDGSGGLKEFAKNKQKTIRKQNGLGIFATQRRKTNVAALSCASDAVAAARLVVGKRNASSPRCRFAQEEGRSGGRINLVPVMHFDDRSEEHTSELQSLMRISYAVF